MLSNLMSVFRKRRRVDTEDEHIDNVVNDISKEALASYCAMESQIAELPTLVATSANSLELYSGTWLFYCCCSFTQNHSAFKIQEADMELKSTPVTLTQDESTLNFDYLPSLSGNKPRRRFFDSPSAVAVMDTSKRSEQCPTSSGAAASYGQTDFVRVVDRFVTVMDQLDARVEKFRKDALGLQENREVLLMSIELIKNNDMLQKMTETEREEISCYIQRVNARLLTVELNVRTVRDCAQEDSLSQINALIDTIIGARDPTLSRQRCQQFLNACCSAGEAGNVPSAVDVDAGPVDKKFESALLGCTLDDQKNIKKRLHALMGYLDKQHVRN